MTELTDDFKAALQALSEEYKALLPGKIQQVEEVCARFIEGTERNSELLKTLHRQAHSLAGSSQSFGFAAVGDAARTLEHFLMNFVDLRATTISLPDAGQCAHIVALVRTLKDVSLQPPRHA